ncbi:MAG: hypothetical protein IPM64_04690 [Phycisphaerales bacterium]|nr:hypothetical protein [Phycisphaerales bacterium]
MRRYLHILANSTLLLGAIGGFWAGSAVAQTRSTTSTQAVSRTFNFWSDDWNVIVDNMKVHHGSAVQPAATLSGYAFTAEAAAAIAARGLVSAAAIASVQNDMVLTEALVRTPAAAQFVGADAVAPAIADRLAARLAPMAGPPQSEAGRDTSLILLRRAMNDAAATEAGVREAARAAGGLKDLMEVSAAVQLVGGDGNPQDPAFVNELRRSSREHIVTRAAANGLGLPPDLANRHAQDILKDAASLQSLGHDALWDPNFHNDIRRMGWQMAIRRQALRSQRLPDDAVISAQAGEILRQAAKVAGLGGDPSDTRSYDVIRNMEGGRMTEAKGRARLRAIADANGYTPPGPAVGNGGTGGSGNGGGGTGSGGGTGAGAGAGAADGTRPPLPGTGGSTGRSSGGGSGTPGTPPAPGASDGEQGGSGGDSTTALGDGNVDVVVRVTHNADGSYNATAMLCDSGGTCEAVGSSERFTDADGDGSYEGDKGGSSSSKPAEGDYYGDLDDNSNLVNYGYEADGAAGGGESGSADPPADDNDAAGIPSPERRHYLGAMQSYSVIMIAMRSNREGDMFALMAGDFLTGTGDSTPTPDAVFYTRPTGDVPIRDYLSNPGQAQPPLPADPGAAPTPTPNPNQINPSPDSTTGGPPIQMPVIQLPPPPVPGVGSGAPAPAPRR